MSDSASLTPISDEQAKAAQEAFKAAQEALKALRGVGGFLKEILGTVPEDLVGYLGGDLLKVRRAENVARMIEKMRERLRQRKAETEPPSISIALPLMIAAADEDRDELQEIWARLLAAAADTSRAKSFRARFIEVAKQMDPLDAAVLEHSQGRRGGVSGQIQNELAKEINATRDQVEVSLENLTRVELMVKPGSSFFVSAFGREFLRAISD
jgi:abortive infection alpha-like protein